MLKNEVSLQNLYLCQQKSYNENRGDQSIIRNTLHKIACKGVSVANVWAEVYIQLTPECARGQQWALSLFTETCRHQSVMPTFLPGTQKVLLGHLLHVRGLIWPLMFPHNYVPLVSPLVFLYLIKVTFCIYLKLHFQSWRQHETFKQKERTVLPKNIIIIHKHNERILNLSLCELTTLINRQKDSFSEDSCSQSRHNSRLHGRHNYLVSSQK